MISRNERSASQEPDLDLRVMVFHVLPEEEKLVRRAIARFGGPRRRRGACLAAALRAMERTARTPGRRASHPGKLS